MRGGEFARDPVERAVRICWIKFGIHGASVMAGAGESVASLYAKSKILQSYSSYRFTTVGALLDLDLDLYASFKVPHYTLDLRRPMDDDLWNSLSGAFSQILPAPEW